MKTNKFLHLDMGKPGDTRLAKRPNGSAMRTKLSQMEFFLRYMAVVIASFCVVLPAFTQSVDDTAKAPVQTGYRCRIDSQSKFNLEFLDPKGRVIKRILNMTSERIKGKAHFYHRVRVHGCKQGRHGYVVDWRTRCDGYDDEGTCVGGEEWLVPAVISIYDASGAELIRLKRPIAAGDNDNIEVSREDNVGVFITGSGVMAVQPDRHTYEVSISTPFNVSPVLSPNGRFLAVRGGIAGVDWILADIRSSRIEFYAGPGEPDISNDGDFSFYQGRAIDAPDRFPGKMVGQVRFSTKK